MDVVCCLEGSDDIEFYIPHVYRELGLHRNRIDFVNCGGKGTVLQLWEWTKERAWNLARVAFFVDRDFDDFLQGNPSGPQLYVTDYYSIESHVMDPDFFDSVWQDSFRLSTADVRYRGWKQAYYSGAISFGQILGFLLCTAIAAKKCGGLVDFNRVKVEELASISTDGHVERSRRKLSFSYSDVFAEPYPSRNDIREARAATAQVDYRTWLRGKFLLWYSMAFLSRMKARLTARGEANRAVVRVHFNAETAVACLCSRAGVPASLKTFLDTWSLLIVANGLTPSGKSG